MAEPKDNDGGADTPDFAHAMQSLAAQAEKKGTPHTRTVSAVPTGGSNAGEFSFKAGVSVTHRSEFLLAVGQMIKPVAVGIESVNRAVVENRQLLTKLIEAKAAAAVAAPAASGSTSPALDGIAQQLGRMASSDSANQKLFDAMHAELKGYKDGFLFDALQKPFIRDLINLYDDLSALLVQTSEHAQASDDEFAHRLAENLLNTISHLLEIFERLDVQPLHTEPGEPVDKKVHRLVSFEPAGSAEADGQVVRSVRPGFLWRDARCVRPEEIVATKWTAPAAEPGATPAAPAAGA
jgi:molecular chaperone GrpE (heat shock protein)